MVEWLQEHVQVTHVLSTVLLLALVLLVRLFLSRRIKANVGLSNDIRRRWLAQVRNLTLFILVLGLLFIWGQELQSFALSVVAIAVAFVIAVKELISCVSGTMLKGSARAFAIGDRIEINNIRGDVVDHTLLTTTLLEIGPGQTTHQYTGRTIVIPNSMYLTSPVVNETFTDEYVLHTFIVPMQATDDWQAAEKRLLEATQVECRDFLSDARRHMENIGRAKGVEVLSVEPKITLQMPEPDRINLLVRVPVPARRKGRIEQAILRRFVSQLERPAATASGNNHVGQAGQAPSPATTSQTTAS